ncbi:MAG: hypothetical protein LBH76_00985 [Propionibacteriaceae bacterium]|jgi:hypothetical protein|nr:hypothetical protein [Propionibacteriaceae bacterium]
MFGLAGIEAVIHSLLAALVALVASLTAWVPAGLWSWGPSEPEGACAVSSSPLDPSEVNQFTRWLTGRPGLDDSGYVNVYGNIKAKTVKLLWRGGDALLDEAVEQATACGLAVTVEPRPLSKTEIWAAIDQIRSYKAWLDERGYAGKTVYGFLESTSDIVIKGVFHGPLAGVADPAGAEAERALAEQRAALAAELSELVGVGVQLTAPEIIWYTADYPSSTVRL